MLSQLLPLAIGAVAGASGRWLLGNLTAHSALAFSAGTLAANWIGAFLIGICAEVVGDPQWRLLVVTGFLGSLTTFSGFSLEMIGLMQQGRWTAALLTLLLHVVGSFALTALGMMLVQQWK